MIKHFKEVFGIYYIGEDAKDFLYYDDEQKAAYFQVKGKEGNIGILTLECQFIETKFGKNYVFKNKEFSAFSFLQKNKNIQFEHYAYAFADFLKKSECTNPVYASFEFVMALTDQFPLIFDPKEIKQLNYSPNGKYSILPALNFYYVLKTKNDGKLFLSSIEILTFNLKQLVKLIVFECANEIKTIEEKENNTRERS